MIDLLIILALILLNGVFAMSELALASARRLRLEESANAGSEGARVALALGEDPSAFLSTVQVGITLISIFNGAFGEASLVARLTPVLSGIAPEAYARPVALAIVIIGITFVSIILGELVPKRIAMQHPETVAALVARPLRTLSRLMAPFVKVLSLTTELIIRLLGLQQPRDEAPTQQEISGMLKEGTDAGVLDKAEYDIVRRAMRLDAQRLPALMTPRIDMQFIDLDDDPAHSLAIIAASPYSRFPVFRGERSHVLGIVDAGDLLQQVINRGARVNVDLEAVATAPLFVPDTISAMNLLEQFRAHRAELALVVDEHGQLQGMVTLVDLMGALVGGVPGVEAHETDAVQREDGSWLMDGSISLERLRELLGTAAELPAEAGGAYQTLAGLVLHQLGRMPRAADSFEWNGYRFEVVDMDRNRIDRVLVSAL